VEDVFILLHNAEQVTFGTKVIFAGFLSSGYLIYMNLHDVIAVIGFQHLVFLCQFA